MASNHNETREEIVLDDSSQTDVVNSLWHEPEVARSCPLADSLPIAIDRIERAVSESNRWGHGVAQQLAVQSDQLDALAQLMMQSLEHISQVSKELSQVKSSSIDTWGGATADSSDRQSSFTPNQPVADPGDAASLLERLFLGNELSRNAVLGPERDELLQGVLGQDVKASGLAARLMLMQTASAAEMSSLVKEIGEAYYRWQPKTADLQNAFEEAIVDLLHKRMAALGLRNSIELVRPGDRYDAARHISNERGVEVKGVGGWVILRENGKPLTKAVVTLR